MAHKNDARVSYHLGGKRSNKKPIHLADNYEPDTVPEVETDLADRLASLPESDRERIYQSLLDRATGVRQFVRAKRMGRNFAGYDVWRVMSVRQEGTEEWNEIQPTEAAEWEGWLYVQPPSDQALQMVLAYASGRPTQREQVQYDPVITILHCIPGKRQWKQKAEGSTELAVEEPEYGEYVNQGAVDEDDENRYRKGTVDEAEADDGGPDLDEEETDQGAEEDDEGSDIPPGELFGYQRARMIVQEPEA